jgi:hypothetical protein
LTTEQRAFEEQGFLVIASRGRKSFVAVVAE